MDESESVSHSVVSDSWQVYGLYHTGFLCPQNFPGKNTGVGCHSLLQRIFLTQEWNLHLPPLPVKHQTHTSPSPS